MPVAGPAATALAQQASAALTDRVPLLPSGHAVSALQLLAPVPLAVAPAATAVPQGYITRQSASTGASGGGTSTSTSISTHPNTVQHAVEGSPAGLPGFKSAAAALAETASGTLGGRPQDTPSSHKQLRATTSTSGRLVQAWPAAATVAPPIAALLLRPPPPAHSGMVLPQLHYWGAPQTESPSLEGATAVAKAGAPAGGSQHYCAEMGSHASGKAGEGDHRGASPGLAAQARRELKQQPAAERGPLVVASPAIADSCPAPKGVGPFAGAASELAAGALAAGACSDGSDGGHLDGAKSARFKPEPAGPQAPAANVTGNSREGAAGPVDGKGTQASAGGHVSGTAPALALLFASVVGTCSGDEDEESDQ